MKRSRAQRKAELLAEAEVLIESLLDWDARTSKPNLRQIEDEVLELRRRFGQRLAKTVIEDQEAQQPAEPPQCAKCGAALRYKGQKAAQIESRLGTLAVERGYYYCACCKSGLFPLEGQLALVDGAWSEGVARQAVWLRGLAPFEQAELIRQEIGQVHISRCSIWRRTELWGAKLKAQEEAERVKANRLVP